LRLPTRCIEKQYPVPKPLNNINVYHLTEEERKQMNIDSLPGSLAEALGELEKDQVLKDALGEIMYEAFIRSRWAEVEEYRLQVSDWEVERYLQTA
jgi:glutamine synthetase